jgi:hypothetical protein
MMIQRFAEAKWVRATGVAICAASAFLALN